MEDGQIAMTWSAAGRKLPPVALTILFGMGALLLLRIGYGLLFDRAEESASGPENPAEASPTAPILRSPAPPEEITVSSGHVFGRPWSLAVVIIDGDLCARLVSALTTIRSCGLDGPSLQVLQTSAGGGRAFLFGPLSAKAEGVWMRLQHGRVVTGSVFDVPQSVDASFDLYLLIVKRLGPGEVIAVNRGGLLVGHAHVSTSSGAERPYGWVDAFGNVIGYVPGPGDWGFAPPGQAARLQDVRVFLIAPLTQVRAEVRSWWTERPGAEGSPSAIQEWWSEYPLTELRTTD